jgi:hypothetical protein
MVATTNRRWSKKRVLVFALARSLSQGGSVFSLVWSRARSHLVDLSSTNTHALSFSPFLAVLHGVEGEILQMTRNKQRQRAKNWPEKTILLIGFLTEHADQRKRNFGNLHRRYLIRCRPLRAHLHRRCYSMLDPTVLSMVKLCPVRCRSRSVVVLSSSPLGSPSLPDQSSSNPASLSTATHHRVPTTSPAPDKKDANRSILEATSAMKAFL